MQTHKHTNLLISETSPYLLQHAHNPVNWRPWSKQALEDANKTNRLVIISIGYSACHWCHVMEHESFENEDVAILMNEHFICIKIDREEHPDIDQLYMNAVQLITGAGGWPLNVVTLPDGKPFWGGTYFPRDSWTSILTQIHELYTSDPNKIKNYADQLTQGIQQMAVIQSNETQTTTIPELLDSGIVNWEQQFDTMYGGNNRAPKFMMPNNLQFLMHYGINHKNEFILNHVKRTLNRMALGGIYDQVGGGFSRYSVDVFWKIPHFEKMLYDNAQLISLYSFAYQQFQINTYKQIVFQTIDFLKREMLSNENLYYSALDADSEGKEGKFYVWDKETLQNIIGETFPLFANYYNINKTGYWEHNNYILMRTQSDSEFASTHKISENELRVLVKNWQKTLLSERSKRIRPATDDKIITAWNAMLSIGLLDAWSVFGEDCFFTLALNNAYAIQTKLFKSDRSLWHTYKNNTAKIDGYLPDYASCIALFIRLTELTGKQSHYETAMTLMEYTNSHFWDENTNLYTFNSQVEETFITQQYETYDNVIPASNSIMANNLFKLGNIGGKTDWIKRSKNMLNKTIGNFPTQHSGLTNWGLLGMYFSKPFYEIVVIGEDAKKLKHEIEKQYLPNAMICYSVNETDIPIFKNRWVKNKTLIYVCKNQTCKMPVETWAEALKFMP